MMDIRGLRFRLSFDDIYSGDYAYLPFVAFAEMILMYISRLVILANLRGDKYKLVYPRSRYINRRYYSKYRYLHISKGYNWVLITLTIKRDIPLCSAWANVGCWVSSFLHNFRTYFYRRGIKVFYFWVIEPHKDGYPHVHILISYPYLPISKIVEWWRYSEPQGIDVKFIGRDIENAKNYILKYLTKSDYVDFDVNFREGYIEFGIIPFLLWVNRVRVLGRSRNISFLDTINQYETYYYGGISTLYSVIQHDLANSYWRLGISYNEHDLASLLSQFLTGSGLYFSNPP